MTKSSFDFRAGEDGDALTLEGRTGVRRALAGETILVTGASGFIGSAIVRALAETGCVTRTLVRPGSARGNLNGLAIDLFEGDIRDARAVAAAMEGARYLFHVAADYRLWAPDPSEIIDSNERGTRIVMEAALAAGVERIVHTSSVATLRPSCDGLPSGEENRLCASEAIGTYKRSKLLAERIVDRMCADHGLPAITVHPSTPIGPGDIKPTPTGRILVEAASGRIPAFVRTGLNLVHVDDVAAGHISALERGGIGEHYILGGQDVAFGTMLADIARHVDRRPPRIRLPHGAIVPIAYVAEAIAQATSREPFVSLDSLRMSRHMMYYSSDKAIRELGYHARPYRQAIGEAISWFKENKYI